MNTHATSPTADTITNANQQMLVLEVISGLCREPLALVEMFVNYDCDLEAIDLFKRIVTALVKVRLRRM